ncbi:MAG: ABC transporter ATP-binding protein [Vicinamibacteria bacterium]
MTDVVIKVDRLCVRYGANEVLNGVSFEVERGSVYALLGRNGAGKSSLMRCLLGLQKPWSGNVQLFSEDVWGHRARLLDRTGYVPETMDAPPHLRVGDVEAFHGAMYSKWNGSMVKTRLDRARISRSANLSTLSKGQRALFSLALALGSQPELLVLDDPTLGLDVVARNEFFADFIGDLADRNTTVVLTTHDLAGVEGIADHVGILRGTQLVVNDETEKLKVERGGSLEQIFTEATHGGELGL